MSSRSIASDPVRVLAIGAGPTAMQIHLPQLARLRDQGEIALARVCDLQGERAGVAQRQFGFLERSGDAMRDLERPDIDAVYIFGSAQMHFEYGLAALRHGKHLFVEKPIAPSYAAVRLLARTAGAHGLIAHPQDPGMPPQGYRGVDRVLGTVDGLKKFIGMHESPYHGLNFCQGTVSEDLYHPNDELPDVIRYFGSRKKIFNVHFRNIRGGRDNFVAEMFPDEGDVDFVKILKVYREVGYEDLLMPDHAPRVTTVGVEDRSSWENFPFEFGYIRGLIQAEQHLV